jgi:hypothetical protein
MTEQFLSARPKFTARSVAEVIGGALGRKLGFAEADEQEDVDGSVQVSHGVEIQVGADYLVVGAWKDEHVLHCWPERSNIADALTDAIAAIEEFPEPPS